MHPFYILLIMLLGIFITTTIQLYNNKNLKTIHRQWGISFLSSAMLTLGIISYSIHTEQYSIGVIAILLLVSNVIVSYNYKQKSQREGN